MSQRSNDNDDHSPALTTLDELTADLEDGCKPPAEWRIGTEHEKFVFHWATLGPVEHGGESGIAALLAVFTAHGWAPIVEDGRLIGAHRDQASVTLEPGGQLELSGAPLDNVHQTCAEVHQHLQLAKSAAAPLGLGFLGMGFHPQWRRDEIPWMPKARYRIMRDYMPKVGTLGLDMMKRTCTVQVNLDFSSEQDMVRKFRVALALQPIVTALFADSPFVEGRPSGYLSYRARIWQDTDAARTGLLPFVFESGMGFERYTRYLVDEVPMYFVYRQGRYIDAAGLSFRDFLNGKLPVLPGEYPTLADWRDHQTTAFPEVRLKRFLEMRGADGGPWERLCALPALWAGLLYDGAALDQAEQLTAELKPASLEKLRGAAARDGLRARAGQRSAAAVAADLLAIARQGLKRRARLDCRGQNEGIYLTQLEETVASGQTAAELKLDRFNTVWQQNIEPLFAEFAY